MELPALLLSLLMLLGFLAEVMCAIDALSRNLVGAAVAEGVTAFAFLILAVVFVLHSLGKLSVVIS